MQSGRGRDGFQDAFELPMQDAGNELVSSAVHTAHLPQVTREAPFIDERGQRGLDWQRGVPVGDVLCGMQSAEQRGRRHDEAKP